MRALLRGLPPLDDRAAWAAALTTPDAPPLIQFIKYAIAGGCAMATNLAVFWLCDRLFFPIGGSGPALAPPESLTALGTWLARMAADPRVVNYVRCNIAGFLVANAVAYVLNFTWVFRAGRHSRRVEITLFLLVSLISFLLGTALAGLLVGAWGVHGYIAKGADVFAAVMINYVCRKYIIFHG